MPTLANIDGLRVVIYPHDHRPAHVHVIGRGCEAVVDLVCPDGPPQLRKVYGFGLKDTGRIIAAVAGMVGRLCGEWETIHGVA